MSNEFARPGDLRIRYAPTLPPSIEVCQADGTWAHLRGVKRVEVVMDASEGHGLPTAKVTFDCVTLARIDVIAPQARAALAVAGVTPADIAAAEAAVARMTTEPSSKES